MRGGRGVGSVERSAWGKALASRVKVDAEVLGIGSVEVESSVVNVASSSVRESGQYVD